LSKAFGTGIPEHEVEIYKTLMRRCKYEALMYVGFSYPGIPQLLVALMERTNSALGKLDVTVDVDMDSAVNYQLENIGILDENRDVAHNMVIGIKAGIIPTMKKIFSVLLDDDDYNRIVDLAIQGNKEAQSILNETDTDPVDTKRIDKKIKYSKYMLKLMDGFEGLMERPAKEAVTDIIINTANIRADGDEKSSNVFKRATYDKGQPSNRADESAKIKEKFKPTNERAYLRDLEKAFMKPKFATWSSKINIKDYRVMRKYYTATLAQTLGIRSALADAMLYYARKVLKTRTHNIFKIFKENVENHILTVINKT
jgi:hypothetical protein